MEDAATIEPLAVSMHGLVRSGAKEGDTVAVVGCGVVGLLLIHAAVANNIDALPCDLRRQRRDIFIDQL